MKAIRIGLAAGAIMVASAAGVAASSVTLEATIRNFDASHPNFNVGSPFAAVTGAVESTLGPDGKPVFAHGETGLKAAPINFTNADDFNDWYSDTHPAGQTSAFDMEFVKGGDGFYRFGFDPSLDGKFQVGNVGNDVFPNFFPLGDKVFHFTLQVAGYLTWENVTDVFRVVSDDDLWLFINGQLVVDLGGVRAAQGAQFTGSDLDGRGFAANTAHRFDLFFAERNVNHSVLSIATNMTIAPIPLPASGLLLLGGLAGLGFAAHRRRRAAA